MTILGDIPGTTDLALSDLVLPIGMVASFPCEPSELPVEWLPCDGRTLDGTLAHNTALWNVVGTRFGGTGQSAYKLPGMNANAVNGAASRIPVGRDPSGLADCDTVGKVKGALGHTHGRGTMALVGHNHGRGNLQSYHSHSNYLNAPNHRHSTWHGDTQPAFSIGDNYLMCQAHFDPGVYLVTDYAQPGLGGAVGAAAPYISGTMDSAHAGVQPGIGDVSAAGDPPYRVVTWAIKRGTPPPGALLFRGDFETGNLSQYYPPQEAAAGRVSVGSSAPAPASGSYRARMEVQAADVAMGGERAELVGYYFDEGEEVWIRQAILIPTGSGADAGWRIVSQIHQASDVGSPPFVIFWDRTANRFRIGNGAGDITDWNGPTINRDQWYEFLLHLKISSDPGIGFVEIWYDGVLQTLAPGGTRRFRATGDQGSYHKLGLYRETTITATDVVFHDGVLVGTTKEVVQGG